MMKKQCMNEITLRLSNLETMQDSTNEATRCIFITSILNASIAITRNLPTMKRYISHIKMMYPDASGRVDYSIKGCEDLIYSIWPRKPHVMLKLGTDKI